MKSNIFAVVSVAIIIAISYCFGYYNGYTEWKQSNDFKREIITHYEDYYNQVESVLDTLEDYDNWIDRFDFIDYYDSRERLDSIYNTQQ